MSETHLSPAARFWAEHIRQHGADTCSVREYCEARGLAPATFYWWRRRLESPACAPAAPFTELRLAPGPLHQASALTLRHPSGCELSLPENFSEAALRRVLAVLGDF